MKGCSYNKECDSNESFCDDSDAYFPSSDGSDEDGKFNQIMNWTASYLCQGCEKRNQSPEIQTGPIQV